MSTTRRNFADVILGLHSPNRGVIPCNCACHADGSNRDHCGACCDICPRCGQKIKRGSGMYYLPPHRLSIIADVLRSGNVGELCPGGGDNQVKDTVRLRSGIRSVVEQLKLVSRLPSEGRDYVGDLFGECM